MNILLDDCLLSELSTCSAHIKLLFNLFAVFRKDNFGEENNQGCQEI